jgi:DNA-binding NarL/FixJ family response regulator
MESAGMNSSRVPPSTSERPIRVMIVDDHAIVRQGLRMLIGDQGGMEIVAETGDAGDVPSLFASSRPDVVLLDLRLRDGSGEHAIRRLHADFPAPRVVVLSNYGGEEHVFRAIAAGANGYVVKDDDPSHILLALRAVFAGRRYLSPEASARLADHVHDSSLTTREAEVLTQLVHGQRNREIAAVLSIAEETVKHHVKNILGKLGARDRTSAAREAIRRGLVDV